MRYRDDEEPRLGQLRPHLVAKQLSFFEFRELKEKLAVELWEHYGHGVFAKTAVLDGKEFTWRVACCLDCDRADWMLFVFTDEVWASIAEKGDILCFACARKRLGRPVTAKDFKDLQANQVVLEVFKEFRV